jgi:hypothetical protein
MKAPVCKLDGTAPKVGSGEIVGLRRATFDAAVELLELVARLHVCEANKSLKDPECDACHAIRIVTEMREQANAKLASEEVGTK